MHQTEAEGQKPVSGFMQLVKMQKGILSGKRHNAKRHNANRHNAKDITQIGMTRKGITQIAISRKDITQIGITRKAITQIENRD